MLSRCKSFCYPDNQNNWTSITWDRFYSSSATWPRLLRRYHWASHVWKRRRASLRYFSPFPPRRWPTPCLVLLVVACCWMCVPRSAGPENLPSRALPQRRGPERSLWRFSPPAKPGAFSARLGSKVNQLSLQLTCTYIEHTANSKLFLLHFKRLYPFAACVLCRLISLRKCLCLHMYMCDIVHMILKRGRWEVIRACQWMKMRAYGFDLHRYISESRRKSTGLRKVVLSWFVVREGRNRKCVE